MLRITVRHRSIHISTSIYIRNLVLFAHNRLVRRVRREFLVFAFHRPLLANLLHAVLLKLEYFREGFVRCDDLAFVCAHLFVFGERLVVLGILVGLVTADFSAYRTLDGLLYLLILHRVSTLHMSGAAFLVIRAVGSGGYGEDRSE